MTGLCVRWNGNDHNKLYLAIALRRSKTHFIYSLRSLLSLDLLLLSES
jgi:hypothetical protein